MSSILTSAPPSPSLVSFGNSRASPPNDSTEIEQPAGQANIEPEAKGKRHSQYYFKDGNVVFLIDEVLYNVHRYFFERDSAHFRSILEGAQGADEENPIVLLDVNYSDFDELLAIIYPADFRRPSEKTTAQWTSVLHLAAKWDFESIQLLAIDNLTATAIPVDKIVLGRRYGISDWLPGAYEAVCTRADPLTVEEGIKLGVEDIIKISAARQAYGCAKARYETRHLLEDLGDIFGLGKLTEEVSGGCTGVEKKAIDDLEDQIVQMQAEFTAFSAKITCEMIWHADSPKDCISNRYHSPCAPCRAPKELDERRLKREDKEDKERRLKDLREKHDGKQRNLAEKQKRMTLFR